MYSLIDKEYASVWAIRSINICMKTSHGCKMGLCVAEETEREKEMWMAVIYCEFLQDWKG